MNSRTSGRHDYLINLLQTIAETLFFYQPAIWWVSSQIRNERELCCDDMVVEICGDPVGYARALTQLERARLDSPSLALLSAGGPLMHRIQRLTGVGWASAGAESLCCAGGGTRDGVLSRECELGRKAQSGREGDFKLDSVWIDTVKYGNLPITVPRSRKPDHAHDGAVERFVSAAGSVIECVANRPERR